MSGLGTRYECFMCEAKFYDLGKAQAICPSCGANQAEEGNEDAEPKEVAKQAASTTRAAGKKARSEGDSSKTT